MRKACAFYDSVMMHGGHQRATSKTCTADSVSGMEPHESTASHRFFFSLLAEAVGPAPACSSAGGVSVRAQL